MTHPATLLLTAALLTALTPAFAQAQPSGLTRDRFEDVPFTLVAKSQHHGPATHTSELLRSRPELLRFFSPGGTLQRIPPNWQRQMVLALATGEGGEEVTILRAVKRTTPQGKVGLIVHYRLSPIRHANRHAAQPLHLVALERFKLDPSQIRWTRGPALDPRAMSAPAAAPQGKPHTQAAGLPLPSATSIRPQGASISIRPQGASIPIRGTVAQSGHHGPVSRRARFVASRNEYLQFFSPDGQRIEAPQVFWSGGQRVVAVASGQAGADVQIVSLRQVGEVLRATVRLTPRSAERLGAPFHAVRIDAKDLEGRVSRVRVVTLRTGPTKPAPKRFVPIQTVARSRYYGPTTTKATLVNSRDAYLQFFAPRGQRSEAPQVFWTGGERVVAVASGQGQPELQILSLRQEGSTLLVQVRERALPKHMGNRAAAYHAVKFARRDLQGPVTQVVVVVGRDARPLERFETSPGARGALETR